MDEYSRVQEILRRAAGDTQPFHAGHGSFWELPEGEFVKLVVYDVPLIAEPGPNRGARSGLIKSLRGETPFQNDPYPRMPMGRPPVSPEDIQFIQDWIDGLPSSEEALARLRETGFAS